MSISLASLVRSGLAAVQATPALVPAPAALALVSPEEDTERPAPWRVLTAESRTVVPPSAGIPTVVPVADRDHGPVGSSDERRHVRVAYHLPVTVYGEKSFCAGHILDLSESGAFVRTHWPFPVDSAVELQIELPGHTFVARAVVRWRRTDGGETAAEPGMGIQFKGLKPVDQAALRRFVHGDDVVTQLGAGRQARRAP